MVDAVLFFLEDDLPSTLKKISLENPSEKKGGLLSRASDLNTCEKKIKTVNSLLRFPIVTGVFRDEEKKTSGSSARIIQLQNVQMLQLGLADALVSLDLKFPLRELKAGFALEMDI